MPKRTWKLKNNNPTGETNEYYRLVVESLEDYAVFTTDIEGYINSWNKGAERVLGYKENDILGKSVSILFTPEDIKNKAPERERKIALDEGRAVDERWHVRKDGTKFWSTGLVFPLRDGHLKGFTKIMRNITDRRDLEEAIIQQRQQLYDLFMQAPALVGILRGKEGVCELFNPMFRRMWGDREVIGKPMREAWPELKGQGWFEMVEKIYKTGKTIYGQEMPARADWENDGKLSEKYFNFVYAPYRTADKVAGVMIFGFEVTEQVLSRKKVEESELLLAESEEQFRSLAETIPHIIYRANARGEAEYYNPHWYMYTGIAPKTHVIDWSPYVHPDDVTVLAAQWKKAKKTGEHFEAEYRLKRHDGMYRWHVAKSSPVRDQKAKIVQWIGTATDIHDRKELENNLIYLSKASKILASSLDYKKTLNSISKLAVPEIADWCSVEILNETGVLEQVAISHKDPAKVRWAKELRKTDPPDMNAPTGLPNVIRTGRSEIYPYISDELLQKVAKSPKHLKLLRSIGFTSAMIVPLCQGNKCIGGITFVSTETKRQYTKADLAMAEELANRASMALENAGLYRNVQEAVTLRDNFISVASHELKTPVTSVKIFTQLLQKHSEQIGDEKATKHLVRMDRQLNKLIELIYDLLNVSKIQAGRMEFKQRPFAFDLHVKEIVDVLQEGSPKHAIIIKGKTNKQVYADDERIGQVLSNLISNAIKYSPKADKVVVHLSSDKNSVTVCVEDFGIGMAKEHTKRIFERFYRVFDTTDKTFPGLGIGLYISAEIVKRHHGKLWVESDTGKGSKFYFSLPLNRDKKPNGVQVL
jgi:PAS domain S-box-containing protein